jgi:hypothetical protein
MRLSYKNFMKFCLKTGLFKTSHSIFISGLLWKKEKEAFLNAVGPYEGLLEIMLKYYSSLNKGPVSKKIRMFSFYLEILIKNVLLLENNGCKNLVLYDDGIFHNNDGLVLPHSLEDAMEKHPEMSLIANPIAVINCYASLEENIRRRKKRVDNGRGTFLEIGMDDSVLKQLSIDSIEASKSKIEQMKVIGIPVLDVNMQDSIESNTTRVIEFVRNYV